MNLQNKTAFHFLVTFSLIKKFPKKELGETRKKLNGTKQHREMLMNTRCQEHVPNPPF